jgi:hypothetical protein
MKLVSGIIFHKANVFTNEQAMVVTEFITYWYDPTSSNVGNLKLNTGNT